jgi:hypothetical protein
MSSKPKVKTYDPSKKEAYLQNRRLDLEQIVNKESLAAQKNATDLASKANLDLNEGLGLLSQYLDTRVKAQNDITGMYKDMNTQDVPALYDQARMGASFIIDNLGTRVKEQGKYKHG